MSDTRSNIRLIADRSVMAQPTPRADQDDRARQPTLTHAMSGRLAVAHKNNLLSATVLPEPGPGGRLGRPAMRLTEQICQRRAARRAQGLKTVLVRLFELARIGSAMAMNLSS